MAAVLQPIPATSVETKLRYAEDTMLLRILSVVSLVAILSGSYGHAASTVEMCKNEELNSFRRQRSDLENERLHMKRDSYVEASRRIDDNFARRQEYCKTTLSHLDPALPEPTSSAAP